MILSCFQRKSTYLVLMLTGLNMLPSDAQTRSFTLQFADHESLSEISSATVQLIDDHGKVAKTIVSDDQGTVIITQSGGKSLCMLISAQGFLKDSICLDEDDPAYQLRTLHRTTTQTAVAEHVGPPAIHKKAPSQRTMSKMEVARVMPLVRVEKQGARMARIERLPLGYTGYTIKLEVGSAPIKGDHDMVSGLGKIMWQKDGRGGYFYYAGKFINRSNAEHFFEEKISSRMPDAEIIEFISGLRQ